MLTTELVLIDFLSVSIAAVVAYLTYAGTHGDAADRGFYLAAAALLPIAWVAAAALSRAYDLRFIGVGTAEFARTFRAAIYMTVLAAVVSYAGDLQLARGFIGVAIPLALVLAWGGRYLGRVRLHRLRRSGRAMNRVLAVGTAASVTSLAQSMRRDPSTGLHVVAASLPPHEAGDPSVRSALAEVGITVLGEQGSVRDAVTECAARSVAVTAGDVSTAALRAISWELEGSGADLIVSTGLIEVAERRLHVQSAAGLPLLRVDEPQYSGLRRALKAVFDRSAAAVALLLAAPVLLVLGLLVRCTSRGPAFYSQIRVGRDGVPFRMTKFRSMYVGSDKHVEALADHNEASDGLLFKMRDDPRVTPIGKILRRFSLDELPQLFQVFTGAMSLVGPRPPLPSEVAQYGDDVRRRLLVKPGLTGLWQVSGRSDLSWEDSVRLDLHYVENWSFALDMVVLMKTARAVVKATGAY